MVLFHRNALRGAVLASALCLSLAGPRFASAQGGAQARTISFGATGATLTNPCPPNVPCLEMCGFPPPIDFLPPDANFVGLTPDGAISKPYSAKTTTATNNGGEINGLIFAAVAPKIRVTPTLGQVILRFDYTGPFVFTSNIPGYDLTGEDQGSLRIVTLTAGPGTTILLGSPITDSQGNTVNEEWNLMLQNANDTGIPPVFFNSTLTGQGYRVAQTPEPGGLALLGGLVALSGAIWRRRKSR